MDPSGRSLALFHWPTDRWDDDSLANRNRVFKLFEPVGTSHFTPRTGPEKCSNRGTELDCLNGIREEIPSEKPSEGQIHRPVIAYIFLPDLETALGRQRCRSGVSVIVTFTVSWRAVGHFSPCRHLVLEHLKIGIERQASKFGVAYCLGIPDATRFLQPTQSWSG